eukprot:COSAG01_NODE_376_length_17942_cov_1753.560164_10_plen_42_part_00
MTAEGSQKFSTFCLDIEGNDCTIYAVFYWFAMKSFRIGRCA